MTARTQIVWTCDRCTRAEQSDALGRPDQWLSLKEQRSNREINVLPPDGLDLCRGCSDDLRTWLVQRTLRP